MVDRLAWGYVREELRPLIKDRDKDGPLAHVFDPRSRPFDGGNLSESALRRYQQKIRTNMDTLGAFGLETTRAKLIGTGAAANIKSFYFWKLTTYQLSHLLEDKSDHDETLLALSHMNFALDRKRLVADDIECSLLMNDHTLYRMIDRGCVPNRPLAYLNNRVNEWYPFAASCTFLYESLGSNPSILVPLGPGALLAKMSFTHTVYSDKPSGDASRPNQPAHLARLTMNAKGGAITDIPVLDVLQTKFNDNDGRSTMQFATWIHQAQFSTDQWWVYQKISELMESFKDVMMVQRNMVHSFHQGELYIDRAKEFADRITEMMSNPRWDRACKL